MLCLIMPLNKQLTALEIESFLDEEDISDCADVISDLIYEARKRYCNGAHPEEACLPIDLQKTILLHIAMHHTPGIPDEDIEKNVLADIEKLKSGDRLPDLE